jgi:hypothetical protein
MFNFYFYGKDKEKQVYTRRLFDYISTGRYQPYTSVYVVRELQDDTKEKFDTMMALVDNGACWQV